MSMNREWAHLIKQQLYSCPQVQKLPKVNPMRYDLIFQGETNLAQRAAFQAIQEKRLVALIRTQPLQESIFHFPLETWNWRDVISWSDLQSQFRAYEEQVFRNCVKAGIDLYQAQPLEINEHSIMLSARNGQLIKLEADQILTLESPKIDLPTWLQTEVPHVTPLTRVSGLARLPDSVLIEGHSLASLRFAVMCARLNRTVAISSFHWDLPEFEFEMTELEDEANRRGVIRFDQNEMLSISEPSAGQFDFCLLNGEVYRTGLYVFARESISTFPDRSSPDSVLQSGVLSAVG